MEQTTLETNTNPDQTPDENSLSSDQDTGQTEQTPPADVIPRAEYDRIASEYQNLRQAVQTYAQQQLAQQQQQSVPQPQTQLDPDLVVTDPATWQKSLQEQLNQQIARAAQQYATPIQSNIATLARNASATNPKYKEVYDRWGSEIDRYANDPSIHPSQKANAAFWDGLAKIVKADHVDELVQEKAKKHLKNMPAVESGGNVGGIPVSPEESKGMDAIAKTPYGKQLIANHGKRAVLNVCEKRGITLDQFAKECENTNITRNPHNPSEWVNRDIVRNKS